SAEEAGTTAGRPYLASLRADLDGAVITEVERIPPDVVAMNTGARLRDGRRTWTMTLVFPEDADPEVGAISVLAPLGAALLGRRVGERVRFRIPGGAERACELLSVRHRVEAAGRLDA